MDLKLIKDLITEVEKFTKESPSGSINDFRLWLNDRAYERDNPANLFEKFELEVFDLENEICKQILLLHRFAKQMIRKGLSNFPQLVNEEFTYLYRLIDYDSLTKMQLVDKNGHEKQTGMEIIKRLRNNGLVDEFNDPDDKRTKRVKVTKEGLNVFKNSTRDVTVVARILTADLNVEEKNILLNILKKLNEFHFNVYRQHKDDSVEVIEGLLN